MIGQSLINKIKRSQTSQRTGKVRTRIPKSLVKVMRIKKTLPRKRTRETNQKTRMREPETESKTIPRWIRRSPKIRRTKTIKTQRATKNRPRLASRKAINLFPPENLKKSAPDASCDNTPTSAASPLKLGAPHPADLKKIGNHSPQ